MASLEAQVMSLNPNTRRQSGQGLSTGHHRVKLAPMQPHELMLADTCNAYAPINPKSNKKLVLTGGLSRGQARALSHPRQRQYIVKHKLGANQRFIKNNIMGRGCTAWHWTNAKAAPLTP
ncbi:hypothetical protein NDU88_012114 [Pleurodeles waltl]|uniref:Uncharacterized protein n=1 Tax=Pleurodeles waltl TaxID=8319 RepID=A0AAV7QZR3_PLEWA|nr:hypothetical protein NDU88_012114 [Pleurodeles waltl]